MADDKKKSAPAPSPFHKNHLYETMLVAVVLLFITIILNRFWMYVNTLNTTPITSFWDHLTLFLAHLWRWWKPCAVLLTLGAAWWGYDSSRKLKALQKEEATIYGPEISDELFMNKGVPEERVNKKWEHVLSLLNSGTSAGWRQSIIEADIMLDELLKAQQYHGESLGERLKAVEPSDMLTLDDAWEAHKVRNRIAHAGSAFELSEREAKRVVSLFEKVFKEFEII